MTATTAETVPDLRRRLATILTDLDQQGSTDGEIMFMLGSIATRLCKLTSTTSWLQFKASLKPAELAPLLSRIGLEGEQYLREGKTKQAYGLQAIAISLVVSRHTDPVLKDGEQLIDAFIERTVTNYRTHAEPHLRKTN